MKAFLPKLRGAQSRLWCLRSVKENITVQTDTCGLLWLNRVRGQRESFFIVEQRSDAWDKHCVVVRYAREEKLLGFKST